MLHVLPSKRWVARKLLCLQTDFGVFFAHLCHLLCQFFPHEIMKLHEIGMKGSILGPEPQVPFAPGRKDKASGAECPLWEGPTCKENGSCSSFETLCRGTFC